MQWKSLLYTLKKISCGEFDVKGYMKYKRAMPEFEVCNRLAISWHGCLIASLFRVIFITLVCTEIKIYPSTILKNRF